MPTIDHMKFIVRKAMCYGWPGEEPRTWGTDSYQTYQEAEKYLLDKRILSE